MLRHAHVDARYANGEVTIAARGRQDVGGSFAITTRTDLANIDATTATISAKKLELGPLARLVVPGMIGVRGTLDADLRIRGLDPTTAVVEGRASVREAGLPLTDELGALHDATIEVEVRGQRARVSLEGGIEFRDGITVRGHANLVGLLPETGELDMTVQDLSLITTVAPKIGGTVHADIARTDVGWKIDAKVASGRVVIPSKPGRELHQTGIPDNMVMVDGVIPPVRDPRTSAARRAGAIIEVALEIRPIQVESDEFRGRVSGALEATLGGDRVVVTGRVAASRGDVMLFERRYRIDRASVRFDGGIDPILDILLVHEFPQQLTLRVAISGRLSDPQLALSADRGGYSEAQLLGFVLGGRPGTESGPLADDGAKQAATAAITQVLGKYLGQLVPVRIDILRYEAATSAHSGALTIGRRLSDRLFVSWRSRVAARADENTGEALLEYWLWREFLLDGVVGNRGVHGLDLLWRHRW